MKLLLWMFQFAFGCHHGHLSRIFTIERRTYQVCLECGQKFDYSWELMRPVRSKIAEDAYALLSVVRCAEVSAT